jgi:hypothetical protein
LAAVGLTEAALAEATTPAWAPVMARTPRRQAVRVFDRRYFLVKVSPRVLARASSVAEICIGSIDRRTSMSCNDASVHRYVDENHQGFRVLEQEFVG